MTGANKREVVKKLYEENGKSSFEPSDLKAHRMVTVVLDRATEKVYLRMLKNISLLDLLKFKSEV